MVEMNYIWKSASRLKLYIHLINMKMKKIQEYIWTAGF